MKTLGLCVDIGTDYIVLQNPRTLLSHRYPSTILGTIAVLADKPPSDVTPDDIGYLDVDVEDGKVVSFSWADEDDVEFEEWLFYHTVE